MNRLTLLISLAVLLTPNFANATSGKDRSERDHHRKISADEITLAGVGLAAALGAAGFLVLRRRKTA
ncbi:MAG TPA: LPXTG cell wall anchor domain-containing protein [Candidatus Acidoferrum sp.]|nr:LPXTG cell wall anchor domain-containing protein [Candidatus Acidoferrum sp.]